MLNKNCLAILLATTSFIGLNAGSFEREIADYLKGDKENFPIIEELINDNFAKINFDWKDENGNTLLYCAVSEGAEGVCKLLLPLSNIKTKNNAGFTAIMVAVSSFMANENILNLLLNAGATLNSDEQSTIEASFTGRSSLRNEKYTIIQNYVQKVVKLALETYAQINTVKSALRRLCDQTLQNEFGDMPELEGIYTNQELLNAIPTPLQRFVVSILPQWQKKPRETQSQYELSIKLAIDNAIDFFSDNGLGGGRYTHKICCYLLRHAELSVEKAREFKQYYETRLDLRRTEPEEKKHSGK